MNTQDLRGDQRVAAFLLSLERDQAAEIMSRLDPAAVPVVAKAMLELDETFSDPESIDSLYSEVARDLHTRHGVDCAPMVPTAHPPSQLWKRCATSWPISFSSVHSVGGGSALKPGIAKSGSGAGCSSNQLHQG